MKNKLFFWAGVLLFVVGLGIGLAVIQKPRQKAGDKLTVVTTLFPVYDFSREIGGDKIELVKLIPAGVEPHTFEPRPADIAAINSAGVFVYMGPLFEVWAGDVLAGVTNRDLLVVDTSEGIALIDLEEEKDPHVWLDFDNAKAIVDKIAAALAEADPTNQAFYLANAVEYKKALAELDMKYRSTLADCESRRVVYGGHYVLGYLAKRYGLNYLPAIKGFEPDTEPTANDLIELTDQVRKNGIKYIFYEELASPRVAEVLAEETGTGLLPLNPAENIAREDLEKGTSFLLLMEENLANLKTGLVCR